VGLFATVREFLKVDFLASVHSKRPLTGREVGVTLTNAVLRVYEGPRLAASAKIKRVEVGRNRDFLDCFAVTDGKYYAENKRTLGFSADTGRWYPSSGLMVVDKGARVTDANMDLRAEKFTYNRRGKLLEVTGKLSGKFHAGKLNAANLRYDLRAESYRVLAPHWVGQVETPTPQGGTKKVKWDVKATSWTRAKDVETYMQGEATDGEVIIKADKIERNVRTDVIVATGKVLYFSKEANVTCAKVTVYRPERRAVLEGAVTMLIKPKDQQKLEVAEILPARPVVPEEIAKQRPAASRKTRFDRQPTSASIRSPSSPTRSSTGTSAGSAAR
jgi:lipopolysaccharide export system protein LptA